MNKRKQLLVLVFLLALCATLLWLIWIDQAEMFEFIKEMWGIDVEEHVPGVLLIPTPGPSPTPDPNIYAMTPLAPWLSERRREELTQRARALYDCSKCYVDFEIENPAFNRVFPRARMFAVRWDRPLLDSDKYETMVSLGDKDYGMPIQFNRLMLDAGYELDDETLDELAQALIITALHPMRIIQPVTCEDGKEIDELQNGPGASIRYTYEISCYVSYNNTNIIVKFHEFDDQFQCVESIVENTEAEYAFVATCPGQVSKEKE